MKSIADDVEKILDVKREWITILIDEYERENWSTAGELHSIKLGKGFGRQTK